MRSLSFLGNGLRCTQIHIVHGKNSDHLCACAVGVPSDSPSNRYATPTQNRTCLIKSPACAAKLPTWQKPYWESMSLGKSCLNQLAHLAPLPSPQALYLHEHQGELGLQTTSKSSIPKPMSPTSSSTKAVPKQPN